MSVSDTTPPLPFTTRPAVQATAAASRTSSGGTLPAGPSSRPIGEFPIHLSRPRDVSEVRLTPQFLDLHRTIWDALKVEVQKTHAKADL